MNGINVVDTHDFFRLLGIHEYKANTTLDVMVRRGNSESLLLKIKPLPKVN